MSLAVDKTLLQDIIDIFIKKKPIQYSNKIKNLFKYIQPPIVIGSFQFKDKRGLVQSQGIIKSIKADNEEELAKKTKLKLILSEIKNDFPYVNINNDEFEVNFTATYTQNSDKRKVIEHLNSLFQESEKIEIYDKYLLNDNGDSINIAEHKSVKIINQLIINLTNQKFEIFCKNSGGNRAETNRIQQRKSSINYNNLTFNHNNLSNHDRYIKIYKNNQINYEIILSSGLYNILGNKDFTYVVRTF